MSAQEYYQDRTMPAPEVEQGPAAGWEPAGGNASMQEQLRAGASAGPSSACNSEMMERVGLAPRSGVGGLAAESIESGSAGAGPVGVVGSNLQGAAAETRGTAPSATGGLLSGLPDIGPALGGPFQRQGGFGEGQFDYQLFENGPYISYEGTKEGFTLGGGLAKYEKDGHTVELGSAKIRGGRYKNDDDVDTYGLTGEATGLGYKYKDKDGREVKVGGTATLGGSWTPGRGFEAGGSAGVGASYSEENKETGEYRRYGVSVGPSGAGRGYTGDAQGKAGGGGFDIGPITYDRRSRGGVGPGANFPGLDEDPLPVTFPRKNKR